ncbi:hypothetical protein ABZ721_14240 [Streptomyces sp. NPDC006733]|uniref:hypothetical protein n=1 Tax=Streptomyces sp. NPDC006733 TaxID=3155460 RepID=UPI0033C0AE56
MTLRALVVCPETYGESIVPDLPGSAECAAQLVRWLLTFSDEICQVTVFADLRDAGAETLHGLVGDSGRHRIDIRPPDQLLAEFDPQQGGLRELGTEDSFVLYWLGHGMSLTNGEQWLFLPSGRMLDLASIQRSMNRDGRPARQLYVIDACREDGARALSHEGRIATSFSHGSGVPRSDHVDQLELQATRPGDQAVFDGQGGLFSRHLAEAVRGDDSKPWAALDLDRMAGVAEQLEGQFLDRYKAGELDSIPTRFYITRRGVPVRRGDYRPHVTVTEEQAEELRRILVQADVGQRRQGDVRACLSAEGLTLPDPEQPFAEMAAHVAQLPRPHGHPPHITTLCAALLSHPRAGTKLKNWYGKVAERAGLPPLKQPLYRTESACFLVVAFCRATEFTEGVEAVPGPDAETHYTARAWFYAGPRLEPIGRLPGAWPKSRLHEAFRLTYEQAALQVGSALNRARVEFIVERDLFDHDFHAFPKYEVEEGVAPTIGDAGALVVRDQWRHRRGAQLHPWQDRGPVLDSSPAAPLMWRLCADQQAGADQRAGVDASGTVDAEGVSRAFSRNDDDAPAGIVLSRPRDSADGKHIVSSALNAGAVLAIWPRVECHADCPIWQSAPPCHRLALDNGLREKLLECRLEEVPEIMYALRQHPSGVGTFRNVTVLFDDPRRSPLVRTAVATPVEGDAR